MVDLNEMNFVKENHLMLRLLVHLVVILFENYFS